MIVWAWLGTSAFVGSNSVCTILYHYILIINHIFIAQLTFSTKTCVFLINQTYNVTHLNYKNNTIKYEIYYNFVNFV